MTKDDLIIRGEKLSSLMEKGSFSDAIFLLLSGKNPTAKESQLFSALLVSAIDHGMGTTSSMTSRFVMSTGNDLNTAVGAGVLALGKYHGGAIEEAMKQLSSSEKPEVYVASAIKNKTILFGFGHKIYTDHDPRVQQLLKLCKKIDFKSMYIDRALAVERSIEKIKGKKLVLNIDGFIAAALLGMGFSPSVGKGVFIIGRIPGLVAQAVEEKEREKPVRRVEEEEIVYDGK